jgi:hypothetical protein
MLNPATRGVPRVPPSRLAAPHSYFFAGGGISKKEWAAKARGGFLLGKRKCGIQIQKVLAIQSSLRNGEMQIYMCLPHPPVRTHHPRRFRKNYKTAGMAPYIRKPRLCGAFKTVILLCD